MLVGDEVPRVGRDSKSLWICLRQYLYLYCHAAVKRLPFTPSVPPTVPAPSLSHTADLPLPFPMSLTRLDIFAIGNSPLLDEIVKSVLAGAVEGSHLPLGCTFLHGTPHLNLLSALSPLDPTLHDPFQFSALTYPTSHSSSSPATHCAIWHRISHPHEKWIHSPTSSTSLEGCEALARLYGNIHRPRRKVLYQGLTDRNSQRYER